MSPTSSSPIPIPNTNTNTNPSSSSSSSHPFTGTSLGLGLGLGLGSLTEICIVTPSLLSTLSSLSHLGLDPGHFRTHSFNASTLSHRTFRGHPSNYTLRVSFIDLSPLGVVLEIMQPTGESKGNGDSDSPSLMSEWLARNGGRAGVQHVAFDLGGGSMEERVERMKERGFEVIMSGVWKGGNGRGGCRFAFFDTEEKGLGVCVETIEFTDGWVEPEAEAEAEMEMEMGE